MTRSAPRGFTLLEVIVAMAILGLSLMAIFDLNAGAIANHTYTKKLTVASLLARSKMTDLEQKLYDDGFDLDDDEENGDFSDEGWPSYKWSAKIITPKSENLTPDQLFGLLFSGAGGAEGGDLSSILSGMFSAKQEAAGQTGGPAVAGIPGMGAMAGIAQAQFTQLADQLSKSVREVRLTVSWQDGRQTDTLEVVTYVVSLGPGSDRNGNPAAANAAANGGNPNGQQWVRQDNGAPVASPSLGSTGQLVDPSDQTPVIPLSQWTAQRAGGAAPGAPGSNVANMPFAPRLPFGGANNLPRAGGLQ